ncbi:MAG: FliH/SctL family protein [Vulcanimicrobiaceae bacterium]
MADATEGFVPIARLLGAQPGDAAPGASGAAVVETESADACVPAAAESLKDALRDARLFRAALADALDAELAHVLRDVATAIVARELELAPVDVHAIVIRALERAQAQEVVTIRVHPSEVRALTQCDLPVRGDPALRRGDAAIDVASGTIDATLGARLAEVISGWESA